MRAENGFSLAQLRPGERARVTQIEVERPLYRRLLDLGLVEGSEVACLWHAPCGEPTAYAVRGAVIALRRADAARIQMRWPT